MRDRCLHTFSTYYDLRRRDEHQQLLGDLAIGRQPTPLARTLASAMVEAARSGGAGRQIYTFDDIVRLSAEPAAG